MKCPKCGLEFQGNFCSNCGTPAQSDMDESSPNRLKIILPIAGVIVVALSITLILYFHNKPTDVQSGNFLVTASSALPANNTPSASSPSVSSPSVSSKSLSSSNSGKLDIKVVNEQTIKFSDSFGSPHMIYMAEVKNTGKVSAEFQNVTIDAEDKSGKLIKSTDMANISPNIINPGETAYVCENVIDGMDKSISLSNLGKAILHFEYMESEAVTPPNVVFSEISLKDDYGFPKLMGRIENKSGKRLSDLWIAAPVFDSNGKLQGVITVLIQSLNPGEKKGFEQTGFEFKENQNFSKSTVKPFAYQYNY